MQFVYVNKKRMDCIIGDRLDQQLFTLNRIRVEKVTIDKSGANNAALKSLNKNREEKNKIKIRQIKYLNNIVEQDHRFIKKITKPMVGFKSFESAQATLAGIESHHMLRKNQHKNSTTTSIFKQFYGLAA